MNQIPSIPVQHITIEMGNSHDTPYFQAQHAPQSALVLPSPDSKLSHKASTTMRNESSNTTVTSLNSSVELESNPSASLPQISIITESTSHLSSNARVARSGHIVNGTLRFLRMMAQQTIPSHLIPTAIMGTEPPLPISQLGINTSCESLANFYTETVATFPLPRDEINEMVMHSAVANSTYYDYTIELLKAEKIKTNDISIVSTTWERLSIPSELLKEMQLKTLPDGRLYHEQSHLVIELLQNKIEKTVIMAFGGTTAGRQKGNLLYRLLSNPITSLLQWRRNLHSIGLHLTNQPIPDCYLKASEVTQKINQLLKTNQEYENYTFTLTGHSKGAAEAEFAALNHPSIRAICFCTPPLSKTILNTIPRENLEQAANNIRHYFVQHDLAPSFHSRLTGILDASHIGHATWLPAPTHVVTGPLYLLWAHDQFNESVMHYAQNHFNQITMDSEPTT